MSKRAWSYVCLFFMLFAFPGCAKNQNKTVFLTILARDKAHCLPYYLDCIDKLDYNKELITVYINTNNNSDETEEMLEEWAAKNESVYNKILFESHEIEGYEPFGLHVWTYEMLSILGQIRNRSLEVAKEENCDFYFVVDCDNFVTPCTLKELVKKDKPIIAPMLGTLPNPENPYSNYFYALSEGGFWNDHPDYMPIRMWQKVGTFKVPVVHCTYLIKREYLNRLTYVDGSSDWEFLIFSRSARENNVDQYLCNEHDFGFLIAVEKEGITVQDEKEVVDAYFSR